LHHSSSRICLASVENADARRPKKIAALLCFLLILPWPREEIRANRNGQGATSVQGVSRRPLIVADAIAMVRSKDYYSLRPLEHYSPDGKRLVVVLYRGNLQKDANDYSVLLWRTADVIQLQSPRPKVLLTMSSTSNRAAIEDVTWLNDNKTIAFLGSRGDGVHQLYTFDVDTSKLRQVTHSRTEIKHYSFNAKCNRVVYTVEESAKDIFDHHTLRHGLFVSTQDLIDLVGLRGNPSGIANELYIQSLSLVHRAMHTVRLSKEIRLPWWDGSPSLSPDGRFVIIATLVASPPKSWLEYADPDVQKFMHELLPGRSSLVSYSLIDTKSGESRVFLNSPVRPFWGSEVVWLPDGRSVVISDVFLPLDSLIGSEREARQTSPFIVELTVPRGEITKITSEPLRLVGWDKGTNSLMSRNRVIFSFGDSDSKLKLEGQLQLFRKVQTGWEKIAKPLCPVAQPAIVWEEHLNSPPKILEIDSISGRKSLLFDPNPQFQELSFGQVQEIHWKISNGKDMRGGLVYPVGYVPGKKYPLVIQTHGWVPDMFLVDGLYSTAFAAQPLANKGIMVLQSDMLLSTDLAKEQDRAVASFEGAIDYLAKKGLIDRNEVGIIGFSRTCYHVKSMLTHSAYPIAAASVTDGLDGGYFQYIVFSKNEPGLTHLFEEGNGGIPFGHGLQSWFQASPGFNIDKVRAPLLITALNPTSALQEWEWFVALSRREKPVELLMLKDGAHVLERPSDRMISLQSNVDWFVFWLKGEEDPDPAKAELYRRWRQLRRLEAGTIAYSGRE
jgi:dipeptidyl aminopeptidase/acylaminoacyl peptidase